MQPTEETTTPTIDQTDQPDQSDQPTILSECPCELRSYTTGNPCYTNTNGICVSGSPDRCECINNQCTAENAKNVETPCIPDILLGCDNTTTGGFFCTSVASKTNNHNGSHHSNIIEPVSSPLYILIGIWGGLVILILFVYVIWSFINMNYKRKKKSIM
jgi:hypothetical protein